MRRYGLELGCIVGAVLAWGPCASAQSTLDALQQELNEAKQQHQDATTQVLTNFFSQVDAGMASPDAALNLYEQAGGSPPDPSPVITEHENESASERAARRARDQTNLNIMGAALQLQCGLLHYAAAFAVNPNQQGLQDNFVSWLQNAAKIYPQLALPPLVKPPPTDTSDPKKKDRDHDHEDRDKSADTNTPPAPPPPYNPSAIKGTAMRDTLITNYLGFTSWDDKDPGNWSVRDIPRLYRSNILDPSRTTPTAATLANWDTYIAMAKADERDTDKWNQVDYPPLQFDRACDDYAVEPSSEKLQTVMEIIKAYPGAPQADDWLARAGQLLEDYKARRNGTVPPAPTANPSAPATNSGVTTTITTQGDMTIVTTARGGDTNAAPSGATPPPTPSLPGPGQPSP